jgi:hypothetical protein
MPIRHDGALPSSCSIRPTPPHRPIRLSTKACRWTTPASDLHGEDVYARLTARLADPPCVEDRVVQRWEHTYGRWPPRFAAQLEAVLPLMAMTLDEIETHHLPGEFALLPIVESWYRPDAGSAAYGLWTVAVHQRHGKASGPAHRARIRRAAGATGGHPRRDALPRRTAEPLR